jgi:hypothetical protein
MSMTNFPAMLVSETVGWADIDHAHHSRNWFLSRLVLPLAMLPPLLYVYAESSAPGAIFPLSVPALTTMQLIVSALVFYVAEVAMVSYMAMLVRRMALARDHDPGEDGPYALAAIAFTPFWLASLAMMVPSLSFNLAMMTLAGLASIVLLRHGVSPLLHIPDEKKAHYVADMVTMAGVAAWIGLLLLTALLLSVLLVHWTVG